MGKKRKRSSEQESDGRVEYGSFDKSLKKQLEDNPQRLMRWQDVYDFHPSFDADPQMKARIEAALLEVQYSAEGQKAMRELAASNRSSKVGIVLHNQPVDKAAVMPPGELAYEHTMDVMMVDGTGIRVVDNNPLFAASRRASGGLAVGLIHETDHAIRIHGKDANGKSLDKTRSESCFEALAVERENAYRKEKGIPARAHYNETGQDEVLRAHAEQFAALPKAQQKELQTIKAAASNAKVWAKHMGESVGFEFGCIVPSKDMRGNTLEKNRLETLNALKDVPDAPARTGSDKPRQR